MKVRNLIFMAMLAFFIFGAAIAPQRTPAEKEAVLVQTMMGVLNQLHFQPQNLDDAFSKKVFNLYLERIDGGKRFITQEDVDKLNVFETKVDDEINVGDYQMFDLSVQLLEKGILKGESYFNELIDQPIDFNKNESLEQDAEKKPYAKNDAELKEYWRKMLKFNILSKLYSKMDAREKAISGEKDDASSSDADDESEDGDLAVKAVTVNTAEIEALKKKTDEELLKEAREETKKEFANWFKRLHKQKRSDRMSIYLNAVTNVLDPHTEYYEPVEKENFDISMSGRLIGIGARLQTTPDGEMTKISDIITGGPAWKQKELEAEDIILKVAQEGQEPVDIVGMEINEVVSMIRGQENTKVILTVKKKVDGSIKDITIVREEVIIDEGYVKSLLLTDKKDDSKVGYIRLPKFYADFDKADGRQCAEDVGKELEKLKKLNIKGIILDLRNNGGGSLRDVVKMSGYFIEKGPIVQVKARETTPEVLYDTDGKVQYDGPLIIMVNEFSASASEIMAAAMQDYGRAIIVGTPTYGKGTVQRFFDLDNALRGNNDVKPLGSIKLTIQKFFRVNGGSTQLEGVKPDIIMADNYYYLPTGEKETDFPMPYTKIDPATYNQDVFVIENMSKVKEKSASRQKNNETFRTILENAKRIKDLRDNTTTTLNLKEYVTQEKKEKELNKKYKDMFKTIEGFNAENLQEDLTSITADESKKARNDEWLKDVKKDVYLYETMAILQDVVKASPK